MVFLELRRDSRVTTGISAFLLGWPWEAQSSPRVARESWGLRSSHCRAQETSPRRDASLTLGPVGPVDARSGVGSRARPLSDPVSPGPLFRGGLSGWEWPTPVPHGSLGPAPASAPLQRGRAGRARSSRFSPLALASFPVSRLFASLAAAAKSLQSCPTLCDPTCLGSSSAGGKLP